MANIITGTGNGDSLSGTVGDDEITALGGSDAIGASRGHDSVDGGDGHDLLHLHASGLALGAGPHHYTISADRLFDASGALDTTFTGIETLQLTDDTPSDVTLDASGLSGVRLNAGVQAGTHNLIGSAGGDTFGVNGGSGTIDGGAGTDWVAFNVDTGANAAAIVASMAGDTIILAQAGGPSLSVRNVEEISFGAYGDGALSVDGSALSAALQFSQTNLADTFIGGSGNDSLIGSWTATGTGDLLTGGSGADNFVFLTFTAFGGATITDLSEQDVISLSSTPGEVRFIGTAAFSGTAGEVRYVRGGTQTLLIGDADGDGVGESTLTLSGSFQIAADFTRPWELARIPDVITGTGGNDTIKAGAGVQMIQALGGDDNIDLNRGQYVVDGGAGFDRLHLHSFPLGLPSGPHRYTITNGTLADDKGRVDASLSSIEMIFLTDVSTGDVTVDASALTGIALNLNLSTGSHDVKSGAGADQISLRGGSGAFDGGGGNDWLWVELDNSANANVLRVTEAGGVTTLSQTGRPDVTARNIETLDIVATGGAMLADASAVSRAVNFQSTAFADTIIGSAGNNHFYSIFAGGGTGDIFTGSGGADWYDFYSFAALAGATITDFAADDQIDLHLISTARFIGTAAFSGTAGEIRYVASGGQTQLIGDADGDGIGESVLTLSNREMALRETYSGSKYLQVAINQVTGTAAGETLSGTRFDDAISALGGIDTINVSRGQDTVDGGAASDTLHLDAATLALGPGPHNYTVTNDRLTDGSVAIDTRFTAIERVRVTDFTGSDVTVDASALTGVALTVAVRGGTHTLTGGSGVDNFTVQGSASATIDGGAGHDGVAWQTGPGGLPVTVSQSSGATILTQGAGATLSLRNIESILISTQYGDGLFADASASSVGVTFALTAAVDMVAGGTGNDVFMAAGATNAVGDLLAGGGGADVFSFMSLKAVSEAEIVDFDVDDVIKFTGLPGNAVFVGGREFSGAAGEYGYRSGDGVTQIWADSNGDGQVDSNLWITSGAFALAETTPGSGMLHIVGQLPANDGAANDMTGTGGTDYLDSGAGDDIIEGRGGTDTLNGGEGSDTLFSADRYAAFGYPHSIHYLNNPTLDTGIEADTLHGGGGDDYIFAGFNDTVDGGSGSSDILYLSLLGASSGVTMDLRQPVVANGTGTIRGMEGVGWLQGSNYADDLTLSSSSGYTPFGVVYAMGGNDRVIADYYTGSIFGGDGDDWLDGRPSQYLSRIDGGANNDTIYTNANSFTAAYGGSGNDTIYSHGETHGGSGNDLIVLAQTHYRGGVYGEEGDDEIRASLIGNQISGGAGADRLLGNGGADTLVSGDFAAGSYAASDDLGLEKDVLSGGGGDDFLAIGYGDSADGGTGTDTLQISLGGAGAGVTFNAAQAIGTGSFSPGGGLIQNIERISQLNGSDHADTLNMAGAGGAVTVNGAGGDDGILGTGGNDALSGGEGDDSIDGGDGLDRIEGGAGNDVANGDAGADTMTGDGGQDWLIGGGAADTVSGGDGYDSVWGGDGDDLLVGGAGDDTIFGGAGIDTASYATAEAGVEIDLSILEDQLTRGAGADTLISIENVIGSAFDDVLAGDSGVNLLTGGMGSDRFVFNDTALRARDRIADFTAGDRIDLSFIDANGAAPNDAAFAFIGASAFGGVAGQLRVTGSGTSWLVEGDLNGDRVADFGIAVTTSASGLGLAGSDFLL